MVMAPAISESFRIVLPQKSYLETSQEIGTISQELKSLEAWEAKVTKAIVISTEVLDAARNQIKKAKKMIGKANFFLQS